MLKLRNICLTRVQKTMDDDGRAAIVCVLTAMILLLGAYRLSVSQITQAQVSHPRHAFDISWAGTKELAAGFPDSALRVVLNDTQSVEADSLLRLFKIGVINASLGNLNYAVAILDMVSNGSPLLAPLAMDLVGDIHMSRNEREKAMNAYSSALAATPLPARYRHYIFAKIKSLVDIDSVSLFDDDTAWQNEYHRWDDPDDTSSVEPPRPTAAAQTFSRQQNRLWRQAQRLEQAGKFMQAAAEYKKAFGIDAGRTQEAHIRHALCYYKHHAYDSVIVHLNAFQKKFPQSSFLLASMFWQGKAYAAGGKTDKAHEIWSAIAQLDPVDYHAHRAKQLIGAEHRIISPAAAQMTDAQTRTWLDSISPPSELKLTAEDTLNLQRGAVLLAVAQPQIANFFLDDYERDHFANLRLQFEMAAGYALAGSNAMAFRVAVRLAWRIPMEHRIDRPLQVLSMMYPPYYADMITEYAKRFNIDPLFVSSVIRQESIFNGALVSSAGAIGLMQIMPNTGKGIAKELDEPYVVDSLYNYEYNVRFGTYYLSKRLTQLNGDHVLALCSYNAGLRNAVRWRDNRKKSDSDMFIEDIAFRETRIYVKRIMANYWTYQMLVDMPGYEYHSSVQGGK